MSLYEKWQDLASAERTEKEYNDFWSSYLALEKNIYDKLLADKNFKIEGKVSDVSKAFSLTDIQLLGFLDGINTSLTELVDLEKVDLETVLDLTIDKEKLYYNMLNAKADWLYNLESWNGNLSLEKRDEITKTFNRERIVVKDSKIGRNDPCPCKSGKKYKHCCLNK